MTEFDMIKSKDYELRLLGLELFRQNNPLPKDVEKLLFKIDQLEIGIGDKHDIMEDTTAYCWDILTKDTGYYSGPAVHMIHKYWCDINKRENKLSTNSYI